MSHASARDKDYRGERVPFDFARAVYLVRMNRPGALEVLQDALLEHFPEQLRAAIQRASDGAARTGEEWVVAFSSRIARDRFLPWQNAKSLRETSPFAAFNLPTLVHHGDLPPYSTFVWSSRDDKGHRPPNIQRRGKADPAVRLEWEDGDVSTERSWKRFRRQNRGALDADDERRLLAGEAIAMGGGAAPRVRVRLLRGRPQLHVTRDQKSKRRAPTYPLAPRSEWWGEANYAATGGKLTWMDPSAFLTAVPPLHLDDESEETIALLIDHIEAGGTLDPLAIWRRKGRLLRGSRGHDGRHRAHAAQRLGIERVPVLVWRRD